MSKTIPGNQRPSRDRLHLAGGSPSRDRAVSDVIGTIILLAITVVLVGLVALAFTSAGSTRVDAPRLDIVATGAEGANAITLAHAGGASASGDDILVIVSVNDVVRHRGTLARLTPPVTLWELGDRVSIPLGGYTLSPSDRVDVYIISSYRGTTLASAPFQIPDGAGLGDRSAGFAITTARIIPLDGRLGPGSAFLVTADIQHDAGGRKALLGAYADLTAIHGSAVGTLHDDATHGDESAADLRYSAFFLVPANAPHGDLTVTVTAIDIYGARRTRDIHITVEEIGPGAPLPPAIDDFTPKTAPPNTRVTVTGRNFNFTNSVSLGTWGVSWWITNDTILNFVTPGGAPAGAYNITVRTPGGEATANDLFLLMDAPISPLPPVPVIIDWTPKEAQPNTIVSVTGTGFAYVNRMNLVANGTLYGATWWIVSGSELRFIVQSGVVPGDYSIQVEAAGATDTKCCFKLLPPPPPTLPPPPTITDFDPKIGPPYTWVTVRGASFTTAVRVDLSGQGVDYWVVSDTEIRFLTHAGIGPGFYDVIVYNRNGTAAKCCFESLEGPPPREYPYYNREFFSNAALTTRKWPGSSGSGDNIETTVKFTLLKENFNIGGTDWKFSSVKLVYQPLKPGSNVEVPIMRSQIALQALPTAPPNCQSGGAPTNLTGTYTLRWNTTIPNYAKDYDTFRWFYEITFIPRSATNEGGNTPKFSQYITSTDQTQYFNLKPRDQVKVVRDIYDWPTTFSNCTPG